MLRTTFMADDGCAHAKEIETSAGFALFSATHCSPRVFLRTLRINTPSIV
jgi:hypothetical protein